MCKAVPSQFIRHNFPWFTFAFLQQFEETFGSRGNSPFLNKHINDLTILISRLVQTARQR
ncbi:MAG: hypothetical protein ACJAX5_002903 [Patiriisocius sp.]|jgi:hypothetical protein